MSEFETNPFKVQRVDQVRPINTIDETAHEYAERFMQMSNILIERALGIQPEFRIDAAARTEEANGLIVLESGRIDAGINVTDSGRAHDMVRATVRGSDWGQIERFTRKPHETAWNSNGTLGHANYVRPDQHGRPYLRGSSPRIVMHTAAGLAVIERSIALAEQRQRIAQGRKI